MARRWSSGSSETALVINSVPSRLRTDSLAAAAPGWRTSNSVEASSSNRERLWPARI